jgi:hypothetical protein
MGIASEKKLPIAAPEVSVTGDTQRSPSEIFRGESALPE